MCFDKIFPEQEKVSAVFSNKEAGDLRKDAHNIERFLRLLNISPEKLVRMNQVHGRNVGFADGQISFFEKTDGLFTDQKGVFLSVNTADCLPIFVFGRAPEFVGIIHAGWKPLTAGIIEEFFNKAQAKLGTFDFANVSVAIGPGIGQCCFEVKDDVIHNFSPWPNHIKHGLKGSYFIDLPKIAVDCLTRAGVNDNNIMLAGECTKCRSDKYFSYRREKNELAGEMMGIIGLI
ncbi:MAG TPA: peptidoglycan editing factor PgeF [Candidatus Bipolaricaulota bacterium]|nr:peptidoglycan editing factor PgeF [Candidatus Bipolaricaulota bacterium]